MISKFNSNKMFFLYILIISTLISISSNSWLGCWIGLEINLLSFIPLISKSNNLMNSEASLMYFLTQSIASANFLFIIFLNMIFMKIFFYNDFLKIMINLPLLMKMGAVPFHFWFPNLIEGLSWMNCFILMTWQKISPLILMSYYYNMNFLFIIMTLTTIVGAIGGLNQTSLRKILTYSSINHLGWMISSIIISEMLWYFYFIIYLFLMLLLCLTFFILNSFFINQLFYINMNKMIKMSIFLNFLSLGGLPPFLGFLPKWMAINFLMMNNMFIICFIFIMMALITLFFYIRITYSAFMFNYSKLKWMKMNIKNKSLNMINLLSFISLNTLILSIFLFFIF